MKVRRFRQVVYECPACGGARAGRPLPAWLPHLLIDRVAWRMARRDHWRYWLRTPPAGLREIARMHTTGEARWMHG